MKGSDKVEMTLNIGGEILTLETDFDNQSQVRDAELFAKQWFNKLKRSWPDSSDRKILAMTAYQLSFRCQELIKIQEKALDLLEVTDSLMNSEETSSSNKSFLEIN